METIKAKPRIFNGVRYRSTNECRWAYFLDQLNLKSVYEMQGLRLPDRTHYLPDFYIPQLGMFLEVKKSFSRKDCQKAMLLWRQLGSKTGSVAIGNADGEIRVPHALDDGTITTAGITYECQSCGGFWFANPMSYSADACPHCGDFKGGEFHRQAWEQFAKFGVRTVWAGSINPMRFREFSEIAA